MVDKRFLVEGKLAKLVIYAGLAIILSLVPLFLKAPYYLHIFILTFIYIIAIVSLRTIAISGQVSLAHAAFMGIGAYTSAILAKDLGYTPWLTMPLGGLMAAGIAVLVGFPFVRLRAIYFSMVSFFFGVWILYVNSVLIKWTGGYSAGLPGIPPLFATTSRVPYYYFFLGLAVLSLIALYRFEFSRSGVNLKAIAQSYLVASSVGINEVRNRVLVLAVGSFFVGIAGAGYAHYNLVLTQSSFDATANLNLVVYMLIGGIGSFAGPIIGAIFQVFVPELMRGLKQFVPYISAGILLIVVFAMPQGLVGLPQLVRSWFTERRKRKKGTYAS